MFQTVELPDDLANALIDEASRLGLSLPDYAARLLTSSRPFAASIHDGAEFVPIWRVRGSSNAQPPRNCQKKQNINDQRFQ
jgi:hypothetical protein